jgi:hypothetical protein
MRAAIDAFLDTPKVKSTPNTLRAYTNVLDRTAEQVGPGRKLADVDDTEIGDALTELWGKARSCAGATGPSARRCAGGTTYADIRISRVMPRPALCQEIPEIGRCGRDELETSA